MMIVDGTKQVIELSEEQNQIIKKEKQCLELRKIYHYTSLDNLISILKTNSIKAVNLINNEYENCNE